MPPHSVRGDEPLRLPDECGHRVRAAAPITTWTAADSHRKMMEQLAIIALRPGPSGNDQDPNHENYDETKSESIHVAARRAHAEERTEGQDAPNGQSAAPRLSMISSVRSPGACRGTTGTTDHAPPPTGDPRARRP